MIFGAGLEGDHHTLLVVVLSCVVEDTREIDVEITGVCIQIMMPDLNPEHEGFSLHSRNGIWNGVVCVDS